MQMKLKCLRSMSWNSSTDCITMFRRCLLELRMSVACKWCQSRGINMLQVCDTRQNRLHELPLIHSTLLIAYNMYCVIIWWNKKRLGRKRHCPRACLDSPTYPNLQRKSTDVLTFLFPGRQGMTNSRDTYQQFANRWQAVLLWRAVRTQTCDCSTNFLIVNILVNVPKYPQLPHKKIGRQRYTLAQHDLLRPYQPPCWSTVVTSVSKVCTYTSRPKRSVDMKANYHFSLLYYTVLTHNLYIFLYVLPIARRISMLSIAWYAQQR